MNDEIEKGLKVAMDMEKTGYNIYIKAAKNTTNLLGKSTLDAVAAKELDHMKAIEAFAAKNLHQAINMINARTKIDYIKPIMKKLQDSLNEKMTPDADLDQAYRVALELEKNSFDFYKGMKEKTSDPEAKKFFEFLMKEENTHYELFEETLEYLNHPGNWYREQERWIVEGG